ncbi:ResB protein required for cytochrome c biosynthesis [Synechococcus sp. PCC 7502]|uniref:cytochrome c biogenesis protein n=1 Tax=Synechococcus sp. PCC 7502 TaxID=1173263 RepID=UPI00029F8EC8|nr:cytochrome c biogenesis protein [Synechococcus sp. PCC 7502]AFY72641.1 ResB protein required for cytochrome c biosynthesis [Synechococcus sp. PCC 7502]
MLNFNPKFLRRELLPILGNLKFAIALLLIIALFSVSGTVIEQGETLDFYQQNYPEHPALFGFLTYKVLLLAGLNHVYSTWWFLALLILFGTSLTVCTFTRQLPMLKVAKRWHYYTKPQSFNKLALSTELVGRSLDQIAPVLTKFGYAVFQENDQLYARKGLVGRIGPILVHASMLLILLGAIWGALAGFIGQEMIPSGQTFSIKNVTEAGIWSHIPKTWSVKVNRFWIEYTPSGAIDQFYSDLSVLDNKSGQELDRQTIYVNKPLRYDGITFYQANWDIAAVRFTLNASPVLQLPMTALQAKGTNNKVWGAWLPTKPDLSAGVTLITPDLQGTLLIYDEKGNLVSTVRAGGSTEVNGVTLTIKELVGSTGLQIKSDPGIPIAYTGFGLLMLGVIMSYVSHSQIWVLKSGNSLYIGGKTNRALVGFESEMIQIIESLPNPVLSLG